MKAVYTAIDGIYLNAAEDLATLCAEDSVRGANLLTRPNKIASWTTGSGATLAQQDNQTIKTTTAAASNRYVYQAVTCEVDTYYLLRAYANPAATNTARLAAGSSVGATTAVTTESSTAKVHELIIKASATTMYFHLQNYSSVVGEIVYWSNIEVIELEHYGVDETTELVTTGDFSSDANWTDFLSTSTGGTVTITGGELVITQGSTSVWMGSYQAITTVAGATYTFSITRASGSGDTRIGANSSGTIDATPDLGYIQVTANTTHSITFKATGTTTYLVVLNGAIATTAQNFDTATCKRTGNLVADNAFSFAASTPWTLGAGWAITGGALVATAATANAYIINQSAMVYGYSYVLTYTITVTSGSVRPFIGVGNYGTTRSTVGTYTYSETITITDISDTVGNIGFDGVTAFTGTIDNVTIRRAVVDLSSNADGLEVHGEIVLAPVNYNSTTVALCNFSTYNYLKQPYNSNLDATADMSGSFWYKLPATASQATIFQRAYYSGGYSGAAFEAIITTTNSYLKVNVSDDAFSTTDNVSASTATDDDSWHFGAFTYDKDGNLILYGSDATAIATDAVSASAASLANSNAVLYVGIVAALSGAFSGKIAALKLDIGTAWTAQYVRTVYESELPLFKQNELYSVNGESLTLGVKVRNSNPGIESSEDYTESMDGTREYIVNWTKGTYDLQTTPVSFDKTNEVRKFLKSVVGQSFTLSERSFEYGADNEVTVYKTSRNEKLARVGITPDGKGAYSVNFSVRER